MPTIAETRRANMERLVKEFGTLDAVAGKGGTTSIYLSQIRNQSPDKKTGRLREMGTAMARRLETGAKKPRGWMDVDHPPEPEERLTAATLGDMTRMLAALPRHERRSALALLDGVVEHPEEADVIATQIGALLRRDATPSPRNLVWADAGLYAISVDYANVPESIKADRVRDAKAVLRGDAQVQEGDTTAQVQRAPLPNPKPARTSGKSLARPRGATASRRAV